MEEEDGLEIIIGNQNYSYQNNLKMKTSPFNDRPLYKYPTLQLQGYVYVTNLVSGFTVTADPYSDVTDEKEKLELQNSRPYMIGVMKVTSTPIKKNTGVNLCEFKLISMPSEFTHTGEIIVELSISTPFGDTHNIICTRHFKISSPQITESAIVLHVMQAKDFDFYSDATRHCCITWNVTYTPVLTPQPLDRVSIEHRTHTLKNLNDIFHQLSIMQSLFVDISHMQTNIHIAKHSQTYSPTLVRRLKLDSITLITRIREVSADCELNIKSVIPDWPNICNLSPLEIITNNNNNNNNISEFEKEEEDDEERMEMMMPDLLFCSEDDD